MMDWTPVNAPFPLLRLPREIRNNIYRRLLTIPHTYHNFREYRMHPAVMFVGNRQVSAEAQEILGQNYFVILELDNKVRYTDNWFFKTIEVPRITNLSTNSESFVNPTLWVRIREDLDGSETAEAIQTHDENTISYLMGPEAICFVIDLLWDNSFLHNEDDDHDIPLSSMTMDLFLTTELFPHRQRELEQLLLAPFCQLSGFLDINVTIATVGEARSAVTPWVMNAYPVPEEVVRTMQGLSAKGHAMYATGKYHFACVHWYQLERYRTWIATLVTSNAFLAESPLTRDPLVEALRITSPLLLQAFIGETKALIHLQQRDAAWALACDTEFYANAFQGEHSVYFGKSLLCKSMARRAEDPNTTQGWLDELFKAMRPLMQDAEYAEKLPLILKEYFWAMAVFPEKSEALRYFSTRKYWELLEVPDSSEVPARGSKWISILDARRELTDRRALRAKTREAYGFYL